MAYLAMYLRLSMEDEGDKEESNSIINQRKQIYEYIQQDSSLSPYQVVEFCDDGCSGTNMERPGMQRMLKEVKSNHIRCIIVKDMSRFSRDYIEMGTYLNQIFPFMGIRFISINDGYDSREHRNAIEIDTAFQTLLYDLYSKDVSLKVKASLESKCANGEYVFGQVPFGYEKSREVKNGVVVNEKEAEIVRYILSLALEGKSSTQIARQLHEEGVPTRMQMRKPDKEYTDGKVHSWSENAIRRMLNNRFYLGEMAYGKSVRKSVGSKQGVSVPAEAWKVIKGHHEPLISEELFQQVSVFRPEHSAKGNREKHPLTGKLYCGGCGYSLSYKPLRGKNRYRRFGCRKHPLLKIPECCTYLRADLLEETVLFMLNRECILRGNGMKQKGKLASFHKTGRMAFKKQQKAWRSGIKEARVQMDLIYETYALGGLAVEEYQKKAKDLTEQISLLSVKGEEAAAKLAALEREYQKDEEGMKALTEEVVDAFIRKIYAYKDKRIEIEWNFSMEP